MAHRLWVLKLLAVPVARPHPDLPPIGEPMVTDPRDELSFLTAIMDFGNLLRQEGGGVTKAWKPGAPPAEWASPA